MNLKHTLVSVCSAVLLSLAVFGFMAALPILPSHEIAYTAYTSASAAIAEPTKLVAMVPADVPDPLAVRLLTAIAYSSPMRGLAASQNARSAVPDRYDKWCRLTYS